MVPVASTRQLAEAGQIANTARPVRILVTGADGFLGSHLVRELAQDGHAVVPLVFGRAARAGEFRIDLTQPAGLAALDGAFDAVVHAAGRVDGHASYAAMFAANVEATANVARWARKQGVRHFVHFSSVAVYGPLTLGEGRDERTPRLGLRLGLPYMRTKALAERLVEQSGVPYTLVRSPVVIGAGDTVISRGFRDALLGRGLPLLPGASLKRRVSLAFVEGLAEVVRRLLARGPLLGPVHAADAEVSFGELADAYAQLLGVRRNVTSISWKQAVQAIPEVGFTWLVASARFGQHYARERLVSELGYRSPRSLESAIRSGLSSLQG